MTLTDVQRALESLNLQRQYHIKEEAVVRDRQRRENMLMKASTKHAQPASKLPSQEEVDGSITNGGDASNAMTATVTAVDENLLIYRTMEECDSLLLFLKKRAITAGKNMDELDAVCGGSGEYSKKLFTSAAMVPTDDKLLIEELTMHNEALRFHILDLLKECEESKRDNQDLRDKIHRLEAVVMCDSGEEEKVYPLLSKLSLDDLPSIELPPLEMPKFDFDSFKIRSDEQLPSSL